MSPQQQSSNFRLTRLPIFIGVFIALLTFWYFLPLRDVVPIPTCSLSSRPRTGSDTNLTDTLPRPHHTAILPDPPKREASWLLATIIGAENQQRRNIIRTSWQRLFASPDYDFRFIIADYDKLWAPFLTAENDTYGDLIRLDHVPEDRHTANTIKTIEFISALTTGQLAGIPEGKRYDWVSKVDDDTFLDPNAFHAEFLAEQPVNEMTLLGMLYEGWQSGRNYSYPSGRFYTMSWPLATSLGSIYVANRIVDEHEDALIGRLLYEGHQEHNFIGYDYTKSPNIGDLGYINATTYIMHNMKEDEQYLQVASLFDEGGYSGREWSGITSFDPEYPVTKHMLEAQAQWEKEEEEKTREETEKKEEEEKARKEAEKKKEEEKAKKKAEGKEEKKSGDEEQHEKRDLQSGSGGRRRRKNRP